MIRLVLALMLAVLLVACASPAVQRVPVEMRCNAQARDSIDCKLLEFNCRNTGNIWTGSEGGCRAPDGSPR